MSTYNLAPSQNRTLVAYRKCITIFQPTNPKHDVELDVLGSHTSNRCLDVTDYESSKSQQQNDHSSQNATLKGSMTTVASAPSNVSVPPSRFSDILGVQHNHGVLSSDYNYRPACRRMVYPTNFFTTNRIWYRQQELPVHIRRVDVDSKTYCPSEIFPGALCIINLDSLNPFDRNGETLVIRVGTRLILEGVEDGRWSYYFTRIRFQSDESSYVEAITFTHDGHHMATELHETWPPVILRVPHSLVDMKGPDDLDTEGKGTTSVHLVPWSFISKWWITANDWIRHCYEPGTASS